MTPACTQNVEHTFGAVTLGIITTLNVLGAFLGALVLSPPG